MLQPILRLILIVAISAITSGCGVLLVGGAATVASVAHDRRTAGTVVEDRAIELKTHHELQQQPQRLANTNINVTSYDRVLLLSGEVPTESVKNWVDQVAKGIDNVTTVHNELAVRAPTTLSERSNDAWITTRAKAALTQIGGLSHFDATRVKVVTERGIVYLMGIVTEAEARAAADSIRRVQGVQQVVTLFRYIPQAG